MLFKIGGDNRRLTNYDFPFKRGLTPRHAKSCKLTGGQQRQESPQADSDKSPQADQEDMTNPHPPLERKYAYPHMGFSMGQRGVELEMVAKLERQNDALFNCLGGLQIQTNLNPCHEEQLGERWRCQGP